MNFSLFSEGHADVKIPVEIHVYFDNVVTPFMLNKTTDAKKPNQNKTKQKMNNCYLRF